MMLEDIIKKPLCDVGTGYRFMLLKGILYLIFKPMFLLNFVDLMLGTKSNYWPDNCEVHKQRVIVIQMLPKRYTLKALEMS